MYRERERTSRDVDTACVQVQRAATPYRVGLRVPHRYCSSGADPGWLCLKILFTLTNNVDPDEMPHNAAFHLGFHCLSQYLFKGFTFTKGFKSGTDTCKVDAFSERWCWVTLSRVFSTHACIERPCSIRQRIRGQIWHDTSCESSEDVLFSVHWQIQIFCQGVRGVLARLQEISSDNVFLVLNLFYSFAMVYQWSISKKKHNFSRFQMGYSIFQGVQLFPKGGGGPTFSGGGGGVQMLISIKTHRTCDFPRWGSGPPVPPLDPHIYSNFPQSPHFAYYNHGWA